ncbi:MAG: hypothetical protein Q8J78_07770 [Moraxellaceae bacterium]|nr:hypothetical protein [Moraxellaceae bacterium]
MMIRGRLLALLVMGMITTSGPVSMATAAETSLPADLQSMKMDLLTLNREITQLENELLFPSAETAVVVSVEAGSGVKIVDVNLLINDKSAGYHYYSDQEFAALSKGGMHRLYAGNIASGQHTLKATITGYEPNGKDFQRTVTYTFTKGPQRKVVEIKAGDNATRTQGDFRFREWDIQ